MRVAVVVFPGTNCDQDVLRVFGGLLKAEAFPVWHRDTDLQNADLVVLPGGFSYGDYLRTGALAKLSPVMQSVKDFAAQGGRVLGICNGFQILCEAGLLPGVLLENVGRRFLSQFVSIKVEPSNNFFTSGCYKFKVEWKNPFFTQFALSTISNNNRWYIFIFSDSFCHFKYSYELLKEIIITH